jgi:hypothetical protein
VLRALSCFGFKRWEKIRKDSGKELRSAKDIEVFSNAFILKCGIILIEQNDISRNDTGFLKEIILNARKIKSMIETGSIVFDIPTALEDEKFIAKQKVSIYIYVFIFIDICVYMYTCFYLCI